MVERRPHILLISNRDDYSTDYVAALCKRKDCDYFRINSEDIAQSVFTYIPQESTVVSTNQNRISLLETRTIYFRRIPSRYFPLEPDDDAAFIYRERREFLEGLFLSLDARWINPMHQTILGERKINQLSLAKSIGLRIPKTLVTNDPGLARDFVNGIPKVIAKPISHGFVQGTSSAYSIYTNEFPIENLRLASSVLDAPLLLQERVANKADIRVTIVGEELFPVEILKDEAVVDWRRPEVKKVYRNHILPEEVADGLILLNNRMGLVYSAIDLILTDAGEYVFLEVNPVGEWLWLEIELGLPIADRIVKQLIA